MRDNRITGTMDINLTIAEITKINALLERDETKLPIKKEGYCECPVCGKIAYSTYNFCDRCGQRLDKENVAI